MSTMMLNRADEAVRSILGEIEGLEISTGPLGLTVLLRGDPMITVTPVSGAYLVKTLKSLEARPRQSDHVVHVASAKDPEWESFQTARLNDLRVSLHLAKPRLDWRSTTAERIVAELDGVTELLDVDERDPRFWLLLADWLERSGAMSASRRTAGWSRTYAKALAQGRASDRFSAWAKRTAGAAVDAGFRLIRVTPRSPVRERPDEMSDLPPTGAKPTAPGIDNPALDALCQTIRGLSARAAEALVAPDVGIRAQTVAVARAKALRALTSATRLELRQRVGAAATDSEAAQHIAPELWLGPLIDAAFAILATDVIGIDGARILAKRFEDVRGL